MSDFCHELIRFTINNGRRCSWEWLAAVLAFIAERADER